MPDNFVDRVRLHELAHREAGGVSRRLLASWQRSEDYGVPLEEVEPVFTGTDDLGSLFFQCGNEVLADLHSTLAGEPVSLMLTDAEGVVLSRLSGDRSLLKALDDVHLAPGFAYAERDVGTNGLGLALADRVPTLVRADQHYALSLCTFTCAAVPVFDPASGRLEGSVNLTTWSQSSSDLLARAGPVGGQQHHRADARPLAPGESRARRRGARCSASRCRGSSRDRAPCTTLSEAWNAAVARAERAMAAGAHRRRGRRGRLGPGHAARAGRAPHVSARPHPVGQCTRADRCPDVAGAVDARTRQVPHRGHRPRRRHVAGLGRRAAPRSDPAQRRLGLRSVRGDGRAVRGHSGARWPAWSIRSCRCRRFGTGPTTCCRWRNHIAMRARGREIGFTPSAARALRCYDWPGNVDELSRVVSTRGRSAPTSSTSASCRRKCLAGNTRHLSRIEAFERGEIVRVLNADGLTMAEVAASSA